MKKLLMLAIASIMLSGCFEEDNCDCIPSFIAGSNRLVPGRMILEIELLETQEQLDAYDGQCREKGCTR
jgi:hypothetical protein